MSGVCGIVRFDDKGLSRHDLDRQMGALAGLGPDRARVWRGGAAGLGSLLMRTSREDALDAQPLREPSSDLTFVSDARIDNRQEIAEALDIDQTDLAGMADSALIFAAFRAWGADCAARLIGDFVFAAWNERTRTLTLARDHMGQRHVFFHKGDGFFAFATERKGLWALPEVPRRLPTDRIARLLVTGMVSKNRRDFDPAPPDGLGVVRGGTVVTLSADGALAEHQYWSPRPAPEHLGRDEAYYVGAYRRVLAEAVACRVRRATAPVSLMLGGGFDSSAIAALAGPVLMPDGGKLIGVASVSAAPGANTGAAKPGDPRRWIQTCERAMPHLDVRYVTRETPDALDALERNFFVSDSAYSENRFIADSLFAAARSAGARVIMDGNGGDYTLNPRGKGYFVDMLRQRRIRKAVSEWRARRRRQRLSHWNMFRNEILLYALPQLTRRWAKWRNGLTPFGSTMPVAEGFVQQAASHGVNAPRPRIRSIRQGMINMLEMQRTSATVGYAATATAHGLEFTEPFHDKRVVELGLAIPEHYCLTGGRERHLARLALKDLYPPEFQERRDGNDALQPDFMDMAERMRPRILAEIDRMEEAGKLSAYLDFARMRRMLTRVRKSSGRPYDSATRQAMRAFLWGRYIEWFTGGNS